MNPSFSWQSYDRISRMLESLGYVVAVVGPLIGIILLIFGGSTIRLVAVVVIVASVLIALYHFSFSLLMDAVRSVMRADETDKNEPKN